MPQSPRGAPKIDKAGLPTKKPGKGDNEALIAKGLVDMELLVTPQTPDLPDTNTKTEIFLSGHCGVTRKETQTNMELQ